VWRSVTDGPYVTTLVRTTIDNVEISLGRNSSTGSPTYKVMKKMENDQIAFMELTYGIPPAIFYLV